MEARDWLEYWITADDDHWLTDQAMDDYRLCHLGCHCIGMLCVKLFLSHQCGICWGLNLMEAKKDSNETLRANKRKHIFVNKYILSDLESEPETPTVVWGGSTCFTCSLSQPVDLAFNDFLIGEYSTLHEKRLLNSHKIVIKSQINSLHMSNICFELWTCRSLGKYKDHWALENSSSINFKKKLETWIELQETKGKF